MNPINTLMSWLMRKRLPEIDRYRQRPLEVQEEVFRELMWAGCNTEWGQRFSYSDIETVAQYRERVPLSTYEGLFPEIQRIMRGEQNVLWPTPIKWFSKSSGTTNARSKFIPVSPEALEDCHYKGGKDMLALYANNYPETKLFTGKGLSLGGSHQPIDGSAVARCGDVSAVIMANLPVWAQAIRSPPLEVALMSNWDEKIQSIAEIAIRQRITSIAGVPTWTYVLIKHILEMTGKQNLLEVWPELELFAHGAVAFGPYRELFKELIPSPDMHYLELYNASEGFFGMQDQADSEDMLLMLDYGVYYEFIPADQMDREQPLTIGLESVELGKQYALVITTNSGLWRYQIGDTIKFTSLSPFRFRISGRTKHFINAFGEEVVVENAEAAIAAACAETKSQCANFTAAPVYFSTDRSKGGHEWLVEFETSPENLDQFAHALDRELRKLNSDYDAKRQADLALVLPLVREVPKGTFLNWLRKRGKVGGQHKVPRLSNDREIVEEIAAQHVRAT